MTRLDISRALTTPSRIVKYEVKNRPLATMDPVIIIA
jgi:hypothetical protein